MKYIESNWLNWIHESDRGISLGCRSAREQVCPSGATTTSLARSSKILEKGILIGLIARFAAGLTTCMRERLSKSHSDQDGAYMGTMGW